ncbi:pantothenate kinase [Tangfeifania diversioriginum]|uniref:Type III pantothenate kinase n=1 Tax=Tangfeifania diversioriginum TaxID=1168035 RepID=A0A1M6F1J2_9BACT|nr:type III pantothenate kinase [Tangfeifania diversioriginum]SHI91604.1 pantothenate kinase [Tangfeifania diversioriginum]
MLLAIDIGNTNIVFGVNENGKWQNHWRIQTDHKKTADEYEVIFRSLLSAGKICRAHVNDIILSSVVPSLVRPFTEMLPGLFDGTKITVVDPDIYPQLPIKILNPYEIGADLVANAVAAFQKFGKLTTIIDFGTALTFTTIGKNAEIKGVAIAPGLQTAVAALSGGTAQLPQIHLTPPPSVLGENTVHAIQSGIVYGFTGLVDSMIERTQDELDEKLTVVATGGLSSVIAPLTKNIKHVELLLTLDGLAEICRIVCD